MDFEKSSVDRIRARFDNDVERFSDLETGQTSAVDAALVLDLVTAAAAECTPEARDLLDIGCGAGNFSIRWLSRMPGRNVTLVDLSRPMLDRALARLSSLAAGKVTPFQGDIRELPIPANSCDVILAAAVFHHLRTDREWESVFRKCHEALRPGGSFWIADLVEHDPPVLEAHFRRLYGEYLCALKGPEYRDHVFAYIAEEDSPRSLVYQLDLLREVGFRRVEVLHKHLCFAAFGGIRDLP